MPYPYPDPACELLYDFELGGVPVGLHAIGNFSVTGGHLRLVDNGSISFRAHTEADATLTLSFDNVTLQTHYLVFRRRHTVNLSYFNEIVYQIDDNTDFSITIPTGVLADFYFHFIGTGTLDIEAISLQFPNCDTQNSPTLDYYLELDPSTILERNQSNVIISRAGKFGGNSLTQGIDTQLISSNTSVATIPNGVTFGDNESLATFNATGVGIGTSDIKCFSSEYEDIETLTVNYNPEVSFEDTESFSEATSPEPLNVIIVSIEDSESISEATTFNIITTVDFEDTESVSEATTFDPISLINIEIDDSESLSEATDFGIVVTVPFSNTESRSEATIPAVVEDGVVIAPDTQSLSEATSFYPVSTIAITIEDSESLSEVVLPNPVTIVTITINDSESLSQATIPIVIGGNVKPSNLFLNDLFSNSLILGF